MPEIAVITGMQAELRRLPVNANWLTLCSGVGPKRAERCATNLVGQGVTTLISFGLAGALSRDYSVGDIIFPARVVDHESQQAYAVDALPQAAPRGDVALLTVSRPVVGGAHRTTLAGLFQCQAVDMEAAAIARVARAHALTFHCVRVISDASDDEPPPFLIDSLGSDGRVHLPAVFAAIARHPRVLFQLLRLARSYRMSLQQIKRAGLDLERTLC